MRRFLLWSFLIAALAGIFGAAALSRPKSGPAASVTAVKETRIARKAHPAPGFTGLGLTDQAGRPFDESRLKGRVWIADFIFTSCAGSCPGMSAKLAELQRRLPPEVLLVSFSVDPKRDTPPVLAEYARRYGAHPDRWFFLTGLEETMVQPFIGQGFELSVAEGGSPEEPIVHSVRFVLVDRDWQIRGYYDSTDPAQIEKLVRDAGSL